MTDPQTAADAEKDTPAAPPSGPSVAPRRQEEAPTPGDADLVPPGTIPDATGS
jgi:hypothetical protein